MTDIQTRRFPKDYSGLINQSVIAIGIAVLCVTGQEVMKRRRRGKALLDPPPGLGSRESWEFGYLYQGRSWARFPSPPTPAGWPLSWVKQAIDFPEDKLNELRGIDATIYIRFLRGCFWFALVHCLTTFLILFPIHVEFSETTIPNKSMTRGSISSLVSTHKGLSLLWIHMVLLFWITFSWIVTLLWISTGAFRLRAAKIEAIREGTTSDDVYYGHPYPQYGFKDVPSRETDAPINGLRLRTIMVSNIPIALRNEKDLQEYFEYYMSRKVDEPSTGLTSSRQPGVLNKTFSFLFNRIKRLPARLPSNPLTNRGEPEVGIDNGKEPRHRRTVSWKAFDAPVIERVVVARQMTELASLLERREETLVHLETAHIQLANNALLHVKATMEGRISMVAQIATKGRSEVDPEKGELQEEGGLDDQERMEQLIDVLGPFVDEFGTQRPLSTRSKKSMSRTSFQAPPQLHTQLSHDDSDGSDSPFNSYPPSLPSGGRAKHQEGTVWDALLALPRSSLDAYQPLVKLSHLFAGKLVPSIDYYTAKSNLLTSLITENRASAVSNYRPVSTAFVTFADPADSRKACKHLAVHPNNPLACLVTMAPMYQDIDWIQVMQSTYNVEFVKDWVVNIGVWGFTLFWLFPVSLLVSLVSIQNISIFWPTLKNYLDHHAWQREILQSFIPTFLVLLLAFFIPLVLLLIAKKAQTITTLSALHDLMMQRYYKFIIVNVLFFFCVGTAALQSLLQSFSKSANTPDVMKMVGDSFPTSGPFYVGWLIFTTAIHGGFELALFGLPLIMYRTTSRQVTPRKREVGIRPQTFNFYYWLPNHILVIHILLLFSVLNPFILPFGTLYFFIQTGIVKNQFLHIYAKHYEGDGRVLLIRMIRYSMDGLVLTHTVFLVYMVALKKDANIGLAAFLIVFTVIVKVVLTRMVRAQYELDDLAEAEITCHGHRSERSDAEDPEQQEPVENTPSTDPKYQTRHTKFRFSQVFTWRLPAWVKSSHSTANQRARHPLHRRPNSFSPHHNSDLAHNPLRTPSLEESSSFPQEGPSTTTKVTLDGYPANKPEHYPAVLNTNLDTIALRATDAVVPYPPPIPWDDQALLDLPYDNPFYTRIIDNVLWLPRHPSCVLNLDDTIHLKLSITTEPTAGRLGSWLGVDEALSPQELRHAAEPDDSTPLPISKSPSTRSVQLLPEVDGTEEIDLPLVIAKRVHAREKDVEETLRPRKSYLVPRKLSVSGEHTSSLGTCSTIGRRKPSILDRTTPSLYHNPDSTVNGSQRSLSIIPSPQVPPSGLDRTHTTDQEFGSQPDAPAQADSTEVNNFLSLAAHTTKLSGGQNISAGEAISHEVIEEERQALCGRFEESMEVAQSQNKKSWLTSWMYRKTE